MRLGKRERAEARKAFVARKGVVIANLSSPVTQEPSRGLVATSSKGVLGSKSARFHDTRVKGHVEKPVFMARHNFNVVDQWGQSWGSCDREKQAYAMQAELAKHPDLRGRVFSVVDNRK